MKQRTDANGKNIIGERLKLLRKQAGLSQRDLARELQLMGIDMDKNVITRIETNKRYVTDFEIQALKQLFMVSYDYLIDGEILGDIADAIREKTNSTDTITPENMASEIASIILVILNSSLKN